jgi:hypothetical protein
MDAAVLTKKPVAQTLVKHVNARAYALDQIVIVMVVHLLMVPVNPIAHHRWLIWSRFFPNRKTLFSVLSEKLNPSRIYVHTGVMTTAKKPDIIRCKVCGEDLDCNNEEYTWIRMADIDDPEEWDSSKVRMHRKCYKDIPRCSGPCNREHGEISTGRHFSARFTVDPTLQYTCRDCLFDSGKIAECVFCNVDITDESEINYVVDERTEAVICESCKYVRCVFCHKKLGYDDKYILAPPRDHMYNREIICLNCQKSVSDSQPGSILDNKLAKAVPAANSQ